MSNNKNEGLLPREENSPEIVKRYIKKYRAHHGEEARRNIARSRKWFMRRITKDKNIRPGHILRDHAFKKRVASGSKFVIGRMYFFKYDAKFKDTLPVWDVYPLVFFFGSFAGSEKYGEVGVQYLQGINLHYLAPALRLLLFSKLMKLRNEKQYREKTRLRLTYKALTGIASHRLFKNCIKTYRVDHFMSPLSEIKPQDWEVVLFLSTEKFLAQGSAKSARSVWGMNK